MDIHTVYMILGFVLASYAIVGNDAIQTLGTFLESNSKRSWVTLWAFAGSIMSIVLVYGWYTNGGDVSYGRLGRIPSLEVIEWYHVAPTLLLLVLTRFGIPVSTTFLVLSVFASSTVLGKVIIKSLVGYAVAFAAAIFLWSLISKIIENKFIKSREAGEVVTKKRWIAAQWIATGFLWSQWLIQDFANIYVYLPRQLSLTSLLLSLALMLAMLALIFKSRGGQIQKIVRTKTNTADIRSATIIDFIYAGVLFLFKEVNNLPMSTTWVFLGVLAGREFAINHRLQLNSMKSTSVMASKDLGKAFAGLAISLILILGIKHMVSSPKKVVSEKVSVEKVVSKI